MPKPGGAPKRDDRDEEKDETEESVPTAGADDWMEDEDEDPMEDNSLEIDEEETL